MNIIFLSKKKIKRRNEIGSVKRVSVAILEKSNLSTASNHTADGLDVLQKSILRRFSGMELNINMPDYRGKNVLRPVPLTLSVIMYIIMLN